MTTGPAHDVLFLGAGADMRCGVGHFTQRLQETCEKTWPGRSSSLTMTRTSGDLAAIAAALDTAQNVVCNFPLVAWKRVIVRPLLTLVMARLRRRRVILLQHEWAALHRLRRFTYIPALLLANRIVMFSPMVVNELASDWLVGWTARKCVLAPLPPNIEAPAGITDSPLRHKLAAARAEGRLVIGHFGSIYPGKQPNALLEIAAALKAAGARPLVVYIGSFIRAMDNVEEAFHARATELGVLDCVTVTGFIESVSEVFGLFSEIDVFCYPLEEGLTARRSSVLAVAQSGRPVVVTAPQDAGEFDHHPRFRDLISSGTILTVERSGGPQAYAKAITRAVEQPNLRQPFDFDAWWCDVAEAIHAQFDLTSAAGSAPDNADQTLPAGR